MCIRDRVLADQWLNISLSAPTKFRYSGWYFSTGPTVEIYLFMKTADEQGYFSLVSAVTGWSVNQWTFLEGEYTVPANITRLGIRIDNNSTGTVWFDDIRVHTANAQITTFTYEPLVGLSSKTDPNNRTTSFQYDGMNRLFLIRDAEGNILKQYDYKYSQPIAPCSSMSPDWQLTGLTRCETNANNKYTCLLYTSR